MYLFYISILKSLTKRGNVQDPEKGRKRLKSQRALVLTLLLGILPVSVPAATDCNIVTGMSTAECESLLNFYHNTNGANWTNNNNWNFSNTPCNWHGITCRNNRVTEISLWDNQIIGHIPDFSALSHLQVLDLGNNQLTGPLSDFSALSNLQTLDLGQNQLTGPVPDFSTLSQLKVLFLDNNQLTGAIPDSSTLSNLDYFDIRNNALCKNIQVNYSSWPIQLSNYNDITSWQDQLNQFPDCSTVEENPTDNPDNGSTTDTSDPNTDTENPNNGTDIPEPVDGEIAFLKFQNVKSVYEIGDVIQIDLVENLNMKSRFERVDLWIVLQWPNGNLIYRTPLATNPFSTRSQPFRKSLETSKETHRIIENEVIPGFGGKYFIYAAYVEEGKNPIDEGLQVLKSDLVITETVLLNN